MKLLSNGIAKSTVKMFWGKESRIILIAIYRSTYTSFKFDSCDSSDTGSGR